MNWTQNFFNNDYIKLYASRLTPERTDKEVVFLMDNVFENTTKNILDLPCGYGRHAIALVKKGYKVWGVDNSPEMLERARNDAQNLSEELQKNVSFESGDMRTYRGPVQFDAVLNLFSSFGYFADRETNETVMETLCSNVKPRGLVVIDIRNIERDLLDFSKSDWVQEHDLGDSVAVERLDPKSLKHSMLYRYKTGNQTMEKSATWQQYYLHEIESMFSKYGCVAEKTFGNYRGDLYSKESVRMIVVARKVHEIL